MGVGPAKPLRGATPSPLVAKTWQRKANPAPISDRIPGPAHADDFMPINGREASERTRLR